MVMKFDNESTCRMVIKTLEDWRIKVIRDPTIMLNINEEETLWI